MPSRLGPGCRLVIGSLFSGYGGLDMAAQEAFGLPLAFVSDIEPGPCKILAHHHPDVPNLGDVSRIDWAPWRGKVDVLTGGFPCTDVSLAGRRTGLIRGVTRSGLWSEMRRAINELQPQYVVIENVRGLLSAKADCDLEPCPWCLGNEREGALRALGAVLGDLASLGYDASWCGIRAADIGACHGRFRVFILAYPNGQSGGGGEADTRSAAGDTDRSNRVRRAAAGLTRQAGPTPGPAALMPTPDATHGRTATRAGPLLAGAVHLQPTPTSSDANGAGRHGSGALDLGTSVTMLPTPRATDGTKGGPNQRGSSGDLMLPSAVHRNWGRYEAAITRHGRLVGRPAPPATETSPRGGRRLSPRFVEWMMCLPEGWVAGVPGLTRSQQLRALGNGVVPPQAAAAIALVRAGQHVNT